jgi:hypothetical protein
MDFTDALKRLRDDLKEWTTNNILSLKTYVDKNKFSGSYNDLTNKPEIPSIEGLATEEFVNDAIDNIPEGFSGDYNDLTNKPEIPSIEGLATEEYVNNLNNDVVESINEINTEIETKASTEFVNNMLSGLRLVQMTQLEYDALEVKDSNTLYIII